MEESGNRKAGETEGRLIRTRPVEASSTMGRKKKGRTDSLRDPKRAEEEIGRLNQELERRVAEMKAEISERTRTEEALRKLTGDLDERIKEINCLYSICYSAEKLYAGLEEKLKKIVHLIPSGWQYPEIACARIILENQEYRTDHFRETQWKQTSNIIVHDEIIGAIEVYYREEKPERDEGPFLKEERTLINTIAMELGEMIGHIRSDNDLKAASLYTRGLLEASLDPLVTISKDGKIMDVNGAAELITGVSRNQLIGSDFSDYFTDPERAREGYRQAFLTGSIRDYHLAILHTSGQVTDVTYNATVYRNETGEVEGVFAAARDITAQRRAEEALRESENRLRVLSSQLLTAQEQERRRIAREVHDGLGQMLTAIRFRIESFFQEKDKDPQGKFLKILMPAIQESLDEARRIQMDLRPPMLDDIGIAATLSWFCRQFEETYPAIRIEKEIDVREDRIPVVLKTVIYRISQEALNNVTKHSKADFVSFSLRQKGPALELAIRDNGQGFDFEKVFSADTRKRGMGLSSMKERVELSGGSLLVETVKGEGTLIRATWKM